jgi:lipopolysaccharide export LptBFGC system permease protein LptF
MSLKAFHLIFVTVSMLLAGGFAYWAIRQYRVGGDVELLMGGVVAVLLFVAMGVYGRWFLRKLKNESYL